MRRVRLRHAALTYARHGWQVLAGARLCGPVAVTSTGQWMFLVRPGDRLHPELARHHNVVLHGAGSWIPAPPVRMPQGVIRWVVAPHETEWRLPDARVVQSTLVETLPWLGFPGSSVAPAA
jgi:hypothetical protein